MKRVLVTIRPAVRTSVVLTALVPLLIAAVPAAAAPSQAGGLPALAARVAELEEQSAAQAAQIDDLEAELAAQEARIDALESDNAALGAVLSVDISGDLLVSGANLRIESGAGSTSAAPNGKGNLIIGYDESSGDTKTGSHNLVIGSLHTYTSFGGLVAGSDNEIVAPYATVTGGTVNRAGGFAASVSGGSFNVAVGAQASVSGGSQNIASGTDAAVGGGLQNTAAGPRAAVGGGFNCLQVAANAWGNGAALGPLGVFPVGVTSPIFLCP